MKWSILNGLHTMQPISLLPVAWKKFVVSCITILCTFQIHFAQGGFNRYYEQGRGFALKSIKFVDSSLLLYGDVIFEGDPLWRPFVAELDTNGQIILFSVLQDTNAVRHAIINRGSNFACTHDNGLAVVFHYFNTSTIGIAKYSHDLQFQFLKIIENPADLVIGPYSVVESSDGGFLSTGWISRADFDVDIFVLKVDSNGTKEWMNYYGANSQNEYAFSLVEVDSNEYVIGGSKGNQAHLLVIDSNGTRKWEWTNDDPEIDDRYVFGLNRDTNNDWVYVSWKDRPSTYPHLSYEVTVPIFVRRDSATNLMTYKELLPFAVGHNMVNMVPSRDGWIVVGNTTLTTDSFYSPLRSEHARIMKLSRDGDVIWSVQDTAFFTTGVGSVSEMSGVVESSSGSVYAVGYANKRNEAGFLRSYGWLLKITADGCVDTICTTTSLLDQIYGQKQTINVYPNPTTDHLIFEIDDDIRGDIFAETYDLSGKQIQSQRMRPGIKVMMLDDGRYAPGMYLWRVVSEKGVLIDAGKFVVMRE